MDIVELMWILIKHLLQQRSTPHIKYWILWITDVVLNAFIWTIGSTERSMMFRTKDNLNLDSRILHHKILVTMHLRCNTARIFVTAWCRLVKKGNISAYYSVVKIGLPITLWIRLLTYQLSFKDKGSFWTGATVEQDCCATILQIDNLCLCWISVLEIVTFLPDHCLF